MMSKLEVAPATLNDMLKFLATARPEDIAEAEYGEAPFVDNYLASFANCLCIKDTQGKIYAIGGVEPPDPEAPTLGQVWMLCTVEVHKHPTSFLRFTRKVLYDIIDKCHYEGLTNKAWLKNQLHIKWLTFMGCRWLNKTPDNFQYFVFRKDDF